MLSTVEAFASKARPKTKVVPVPEWDDEVTIKALSAQFIVDNRNDKDEESGMARLIIASVINDNGDLVFQDTPEHRALILSFGVAGAVNLSNQIQAFNGFKTDIADTAKNSAASR